MPCTRGKWYNVNVDDLYAVLTYLTRKWCVANSVPSILARRTRLASALHAMV